MGNKRTSRWSPGGSGQHPPPLLPEVADGAGEPRSEYRAERSGWQNPWPP